MKQSTKLKSLILITLCIVTAILYLGLKPKGLKARNQVFWVEAGNGIRIERFGLAYTELSKGVSDIDADKGLTIEFAARASSETGGFKSLLMMNSGIAETQLIVGQWKSAIVVMNGNDYDNRKRTRKLISKRALVPGHDHFFTITSSAKDGAALYIDGRLAVKHSDMKLIIPNADDRFHFVIGNSVYGRHSWQGQISGVAVYGRQLDARMIDRHHKAWAHEHSFRFVENEKSLLLYLFDDGQGERIIDHSGSNNHLFIPAWPTILNKEFLIIPAQQYLLKFSNLVDIALNIVGFMPLGMTLFLLLNPHGTKGSPFKILIVIGTCMLMSLFIETVQMWMPSRGSSMLDLIFNTFGGALGVMVCLAGFNYIGKYRNSRFHRQENA